MQARSYERARGSCPQIHVFPQTLVMHTYDGSMGSCHFSVTFIPHQRLHTLSNKRRRQYNSLGLLLSSIVCVFVLVVW